MGHTLGRAPVPVAQQAQKSLQQLRLDTANPFGAKIRFLHVPNVSHRGETVANMRNMLMPGSDGLSDAMTETDDQIARRQTPAGRGRRH